MLKQVLLYLLCIDPVLMVISLYAVYHYNGVVCKIANVVFMLCVLFLALNLIGASIYGMTLIN